MSKLCQVYTILFNSESNYVMNSIIKKSYILLFNSE